MSVDYFKEKRTGILYITKFHPSIIATGLPNLNIGKVDNHGYEISLGWDHTLNNGIHYYANANMSFARNKIIYMDEVPNKYDYMNQTGGSTERPTNVYKYLRLYQYSDFTKDANGELVLNPSLPQPSVKVYPGDAMYADLNGDNIVDGDDRMTTGYSERPNMYSVSMADSVTRGSTSACNGAVQRTSIKMLQVEYRIPFYQCR